MQTGVIIEIDGILSAVLAEVFRARVPLILERHRGQRVRMVVTTVVGRHRSEARRSGSFFLPARDGKPAAFTWTATGVLHAVIRQFRLDFLRHLGPAELSSPVCLAIYDEELDLLEQPAAAERPSLERPPFGVPARPGAAAGHPAEPAVPAFAPSASLALPVGLAGELNTPAPPESSAEAEPADLHDDPGAQLSARIIDAAQEPEPFQADAVREPAEAPDPEVPVAHGPLLGQNSRSLPGNFYQEYFGFECMPFNNTPDSHFFFPTEKHQEALSRLIYAISERKGFVMISGEIGAGKSTLCRTLLTQLPCEVKTALITHTHLDASQLVQAIAEDLGLEVQGKSRYEVLQQLNAFLIEQMAIGCTVCIIIDEAQNLSPAALEEVRMISNLETEQEKLVQLILLGQPDLRDKIRLPELRQLRQRISVQYHLAPLDCAETVGYIRHRLKVARPTLELNFPVGAMREAYRYSGGVPRLINSLCDNALLTAFTRQTRTISRRLIAEAGRDLDLDPLAGGFGDFFRFW